MQIMQSLFIVASWASGGDIGPFDMELHADARWRAVALEDSRAVDDGELSTVRLLAGVTLRDGPFELRVAGGGAAPAGAESVNRGGGDPLSPREPDPSGAFLSEASLGVAGWRGRLEAGRLIRRWDDGRFISERPLRQTPQSLDGVGAEVRVSGQFTARYLYAFAVRGPARAEAAEGAPDAGVEGAIQALALRYAPQPGLALTLFGHDWSIDTPGARFLERTTAGVRAELETPFAGGVLSYVAESAWQRTPDGEVHAYGRLAPAFTYGPLTVSAGLEQFGGDGISAFQTPFGDLEAFNGRAEAFAQIPAAGLTDRNVGLRIAPERWGGAAALELTAHDFVEPGGGPRYGREIDAELSVRLGAGVKVSLLAADFRAEGFGPDRRRFAATVRRVF